MAVTTYRYDYLGSGWNDYETTLTSGNFQSRFGILVYIFLLCIRSACFAASPSGATIPPEARIVDASGSSDVVQHHKNASRDGEHTIRIILRTVVVIFLTGFFYIFGKSNEGYAAETKSPPIRQELVHEYARKQIPLVRAAHAATYACHEVTSDCDFSRDLRNTEKCHNAERIVKV